MSQPRRVALMLDLEWPYKRHAALFAGTQEYARQHGWKSVVDEYAYDSISRRRNTTLPYDGIIARATKTLAQRAKRLRLPVVNVWFSSPARDLLPGVFPDYGAAGRLRAEHLLSRGFRNFATLACRGDLGHTREIEAFRRVVREAGHGCTTARVALAFKRTLALWRKTEQALAAWMDQWQLPMGAYVGHDTIGRMVAQMCLGRGWRVPEDVAIITGRNEEIICEHPRPSLSSVELGAERIGYEAARLLDRLMEERHNRKRNNEKRAAPEHMFLPPLGLIVRESTDFYAVDDELIAAALEFIAARSHKPIRPDDVARAVATELRTLQRRFRKVLDRPIAAEIRRVRVERAKRELTQTHRSITAIARAAGFGEPLRMYEVFLREVGVSPSEYRKQRQMEYGG